MSKQKKIFIFSFVLVLVLAVPIYLVVTSENLLNESAENVYKFRIRPIDPHDIMRGKFIRLSYDRSDAVNVHDTTQNLKEGDVVYVTVVRDGDEYARCEMAYHTPPKTSNYFTTKVGYLSGLRGRWRGVQVVIPFDRYYLKEDFAQQAEDSYRKLSREQEMYAEVVIKDGDYVLKDVYVNKIPLMEYLKDHADEYQAEQDSLRNQPNR